MTVNKMKVNEMSDSKNGLAADGMKNRKELNKRPSGNNEIYYQKRLGQYFLVNKEKIEKIVEALEIKEGDTIIEIGAGHGELTQALGSRLQALGSRNVLIAVEKDKELAKDLAQKIQNWGLKNIEIIEDDVLKILPQIPRAYCLAPNAYKIVGNIPYYITGYLLRTIGELENKPKLTILTIQKEVAERICARPPKMNPVRNHARAHALEWPLGRAVSNGMNLLAAATQFWAETEIIDYIPRKDFKPMPKVNSAIIKLGARHQALGARDEKSYYKFIKILFKQPRKTILNNLNNPKLQIYPNAPNKKNEIAEKLKLLGIAPNARPQDLDIEEIKKLMEIKW